MCELIRQDEIVDYQVLYAVQKPTSPRGGNVFELHLVMPKNEAVSNPKEMARSFN